MTPIEWLYNRLKPLKLQNGMWNYQIKDSTYIQHLIEYAKEMERERLKQEFIAGYNIGYTDAQCNHINDAENMAQEREYHKESTCEYSGLPSVQSYEDPKK